MDQLKSHERKKCALAKEKLVELAKEITFQIFFFVITNFDCIFIQILEESKIKKTNEN